MKHVSLREFQLKPTDYLKDIPLTITRYGKPILIVSAYKKTKELFEKADEIFKAAEANKPKPPPHHEELVDIGLEAAPASEMNCAECHEKKLCYFVTYVTVEGEQLWKKWFCGVCLRIINEKVNKYGGVLKAG